MTIAFDQTRVDSIKRREDLVAFVEELGQDLKDHPDSWENPDLSRFLDALARWIEDSDGYYENRGVPIPQMPEWKTFAEMLAAARIYE